MKKITLLVVIAILLTLVTACGTSAPTATQVPVVQQPSPEAVIIESPAVTNDTEVIVTLGDNTIDSSLTTFQVGVPYTFVITNKGTHTHNFNISQPVSIVGSLNAALQTALLVVSRDQLGAGAQVTVQFTFPDTAISMPLEFSCLITRHYNDGMKLAITVNK